MMFVSDADAMRAEGFPIWPGFPFPLLFGDADNFDRLSSVELSMGPQDFGLHLVFTLSGVDPRRIKDADVIAGFGPALAGAIGMKLYGPPVVQYFAEHDPIAAGYTWQQLITTSDFTGHFSDQKERAYLSVFSCRRYAWSAVVNLARAYFGYDDHPADVAQWLVLVRP